MHRRSAREIMAARATLREVCAQHGITYVSEGKAEGGKADDT